MFEINQTTGNYSNYYDPINDAEIRAMGCDNAGNIVVIAVPMVSSFSNNVVKTDPAISSTLFNVPSGLPLSETGPAYTPNDYSGFNGLAFDCNNQYYTYDGKDLRMLSNVNGTTISGPASVTNGISCKNSGVWVDNCGNVYVGTQVGVSIYNSSLAYVSSIPTSGPVYDIIGGINSGEILVCGSGFVSLLTGTPCSSSVTSVTVNVKDTICNGTIYTLPDGTQVTVGGTYNDTLKKGCNDSIINTTLVVLPNYSTTQNVSICIGNSYTLPGGGVVNASGTYTDSFAAKNGCDSTIITILNVDSIFQQNAFDTLCMGDVYMLPNGQMVSNPGIYYDTITTSKGCDSIIVTDLYVKPGSKDLIIPNVFTPNGDGKNDLFSLTVSSDCLREFETIIYNRWGIKVFESQKPAIDWDGKINNGGKASDGTYYYIIKYKSLGDTQLEKNGFITLIR